MPASTIRTWTLGIIWAVIIPGMNQFFFFRYPSVNVGSVGACVLVKCAGQLTVAQYVALLLTFPAGRLWARFMPKVKILGVPLNPGPFTIKEHVLITIMAGVGASSAYAVCIVH